MRNAAPLHRRSWIVLALVYALASCSSDDDGRGDGAAGDATADDTAELEVDCGDCDDRESCTADRCEADGRCSHTPLAEGMACEDDDRCTEGESCALGRCGGGSAVAPPDESCVTCRCTPDEGVTCEPVTAGALCNDADCCTDNDRCRLCAAGDPGCTPYGIACIGNATPCQDGNVCTDDTCSCDADDSPVCAHPALADGTPCVVDNNACTEGDACVGGACAQGAPANLDDANPCTRDSCIKGEVEHESLDDGQCDDGNDCTTDDACSLGACVGGPLVECVKPECASSVSCVPGAGCQVVWSPADSACEDSDPCSTGDRCDADHVCRGSGRLAIDDGNACTDDACDPISGVVTHTPAAVACDDGDPCTADDACDPASGCAGVAIDCTHVAGACLEPRCNPDTGACDLPVADGTSCTDGDRCDGSETCTGGVCTAGIAVSCSGVEDPCLQKVCNPASGACDLPVSDGTPCDDKDLCDGAEACLAGTCTPGTAVSCAGVTNPCLEKVCNPATGRCDRPSAAGTACSDSNACTQNDACAGGVCLGGPARSCDDAKFCTNDSCVPATGCVHANNTLSCSDQSACTSSDRCTNGACVGAPVDCDDGNPCTDDGCAPATGCTVANNTATCSDGSVCTSGDRCSNGACAGTSVLCNDNNPCTADSCNPLTGCVYASAVDCSGVTNPCLDDACNPATGACDLPLGDDTPCPDPDTCDGVETCQSGVCSAGPLPTECFAVCEGRSCDDGDTCTISEVCTLGTCTAWTATIELLLVGGGGQGGGNTGNMGAGGGAGGVIYDATFVVVAGAFPVSVGAGGSGNTGNTRGADGYVSVFARRPAAGGGGGGAGAQSGETAGADGGSGGGGGWIDTGGSGTEGQGYDGGDGNVGSNGAGGGGGAGGAGGDVDGSSSQNAGDGGSGIADLAIGGLLGRAGAGVGGFIAGGGGGGSYIGTPGIGGAGGGGTGGFMSTAPVAGTPGTGGGGGGSGTTGAGETRDGAPGGSGLVIIAYPRAGTSGVSTASTGGTITTDATHQFHTFTADGVFNAVLLTDLCDDGDPCTTSTMLDDCSCGEPVRTCVAVTPGTVAFEVLPALGADGLLHVAGRPVPVNGTASSNGGRSYALRSSDLGVAWGPLPSHASCTGDAVAHTPSLDEPLRRVFSNGDWNDGGIDFCASIFAKETATGAAIWDNQPGGPHPRHPIALSATHAFYGGYSGWIRKFDMVDGSVDASMSLGGAYAGGLVLLGGGDMIATQAGTTMQRWTADGVFVWQSTALLYDLHLTSDDDVVGWSPTGDALVLVDGADGQEVWSSPIIGGSGAILTDTAGDLYFGLDGAAGSVDGDGNPRWLTPLDGIGTAQFLGDDDRFYVSTTTALYAIWIADGVVAWRLDAEPGQVAIDGVTQPNRFSGFASLLAGGDIFVSDYAGNRYRLATPGLGYAGSVWPRPRANRLNSGRAGHVVAMPAGLCGALADDFEAYAPGPVHGQRGWGGETWQVQAAITHGGTRAVNAIATAAGVFEIGKEFLPTSDAIVRLYVRRQSTDNHAKVRFLNGGVLAGSVDLNGNNDQFGWTSAGIEHFPGRAVAYGAWQALDVQLDLDGEGARFRVDLGPWTQWYPSNGQAEVTEMRLSVEDPTGDLYVDDVRCIADVSLAPVASALDGSPAIAGAATAHQAADDGGDGATAVVVTAIPGSGSVEVDTITGGAAAETPTNGSLALSTAITVETWVKIDEIQGIVYASDYHYAIQGMAHSGDSLSDCGFTFIGIQNDPGRDRMFLSFTVQQDPTGQTHARFDGITVLNQFVDRWVHVAASWQTGWQYPKLYIDGVEEPAFSYRNAGATSLRVPVDSTRIGAMKYNGSLSGAGNPNSRARFDETRIWSVVRTADEIRDHMLVALTGSEPGLAAYWRWEGDYSDSSGGAHTAAPATQGAGTVTLTSEPASYVVAAQYTADDADGSYFALENDTTDEVRLGFGVAPGDYLEDPARLSGTAMMKWSGTAGEDVEVETGFFIGDVATGVGTYHRYATHWLTEAGNPDYAPFVIADATVNPATSAAWQRAELGTVHLYIRIHDTGGGGRFARITQASLVISGVSQ